MQDSPSILIKGGRIIDPASRRDEIADLLVVGGKISRIGRLTDKADLTVDAAGKIVSPGLIDMHVHLREPGNTAAETIATGAAAAVNGGFSSVAAMPNTSPALDSAPLVEFVRLQAARAARARVFPIAAITLARAGRELAPFAELRRAGAVAFSDDGSWVTDGDVFRRALEYVLPFGMPLISHAEDPAIAAKGVMNESLNSTLLGLPGIPAAAEETAVFRDIALAELTGSRLHVAHVSTAGAVSLIRQAKARGVHVTAEVALHHLTLTDDCLSSYDTVFKVSPPLRTAADLEALRQGLCDGTIDCIVSDHAPHTAEDKALDFTDAPCGLIGLESTLPVLVTELIDKGRLDWPTAIAALTANPARILGLPLGSLALGAPADVTVIDPAVEWTLDAAQFKSKSRNCPWQDLPVKGRAVAVLVAGVHRK